MTNPDRPHSFRLVALASFVGTTIEWYDFFLYGTAAALVFNQLFFPKMDPRMGTLAAFGTYAVGFIARPIGGIIIGHYGDRIGRKSMLVLTLLIMGIATFCIGLLPTYNTAGPWAALLLILLRLVQGFGVGGEWGGAVLMAVEHAPAHRRGFYGSWPQMGVSAGLLASTLVFGAFARLPEKDFLSWGWRIPFLLSLVLVGVGLIIRLRILETPAFAKMKEARKEAPLPILEVLRKYPKQVLVAAGARMAENGGFYIFSAFTLVYATQHSGVARDIVLTGVTIASAFDLVALPLWGALSDKIGRRPVYIFGALMTGVLGYPLFTMLDSRSTPLVWLGLILVFCLGHAPMYGPQAAFFSELFGTRVRYSGASLGAQLSSVVAGGLSPFIATALMPEYGRLGLCVYLAAMALVTIAAVLWASETVKRDLAEDYEERREPAVIERN